MRDIFKLLKSGLAVQGRDNLLLVEIGLIKPGLAALSTFSLDGLLS